MAPAVSADEIADAMAFLRFTLDLGLSPDDRFPRTSIPLLDQV